MLAEIEMLLRLQLNQRRLENRGCYLPFGYTATLTIQNATITKIMNAKGERINVCPWRLLSCALLSFFNTLCIGVRQ